MEWPRRARHFISIALLLLLLLLVLMISIRDNSLARFGLVGTRSPARRTPPLAFFISYLWPALAGLPSVKDAIRRASQRAGEPSLNAKPALARVERAPTGDRYSRGRGNSFRFVLLQ